MSRSKLTRSIAADVLAGEGRPGERQLRDALENFEEVRRRLASAGLKASLDRGHRDYVYTKLRRGGKVMIHLSDKRLVTLTSARKGGSEQHAQRGPGAVAMLRQRCRDAENMLRVLMAVERARVQCYRLAEEGTRWV